MERPNILLIITDHWRGDCLGRLGHPVAETPHLDSISASGTTFRRGYTPSASCTPARRCLVTGMTPNSTGLLGYADNKPWAYPHTMAGELARAGYQTINVGKTHFWPRRAHLGYEELITSEDYAEWIERQPDSHTDKDGHGVPHNSWIGRPGHLPERLTEEHWFVSQAKERIVKRDPTRPFFLTLSFNGPHPPWTPPQVYYDQFIDRDLPQPMVGEWAAVHDEQASRPLDVNAWRGSIAPHLNHRARAAYFGYLAFIDSQIGRFIDFISRAGLRHNTMIVFTSDHGEMLGDHHLWRKTYAYEPSARVPFIVCPPLTMAAPRNVESDLLVGWEDLMPTFLDLVGAPIPASVEGRSLMPLLRGEEVPWRDWYHHEHAPCYHRESANQALIGSRWKYIWNPINGDEQLFDLAADPMECVDLSGAAEHAETLAAWRLRLAGHLKDRVEGFARDGKTLTPAPVPLWRGPD